jgi:hypothetical protein
MPMIDYLCDACSYRFENFYHSDPPEEQACPHIDCPEGVAKRIHSLPGEYRPTNAQRFDPIVIWVNNDNPDQVSMPGRADEPVQDGYHAVEITNLSQADRWTRHMNNVALREAVNNRAAQKEYFEAMTKERRDNIRAKIGSNPRAKALFEKVCEYTDAKREKKYSKTLDPRGHFQVVAYDSSNRQGYADRETGWREKRS